MPVFLLTSCLISYNGHKTATPINPLEKCDGEDDAASRIHAAYVGSSNVTVREKELPMQLWLVAWTVLVCKNQLHFWKKKNGLRRQAIAVRTRKTPSDLVDGVARLAIRPIARQLCRAIGQPVPISELSAIEMGHPGFGHFTNARFLYSPIM